ncbi:unnamed protein product [Ectocarpus sp. 4 AP-2014]
MNEEDDWKQGISREGPLRSIASPPFAGPVAHVNSGPLAHNHADNNAALSSHPGAPPPAATAASAASHPLDYGSQVHQQQQQQRLPLQSPPRGPLSGEIPLPVAPTAAPISSSSTSSNDPLSHLLLRPNGMRMERDAPSSSSSSVLPPPPPATEPATVKFDFSGNPPPAGAQTMPPPPTAEPEVSESPKAPPMPALPPPPPTTNDGPKYYQPPPPPPQQQRSLSAPSPAAFSGVALPFIPPPQLPQQHHHHKQLQQQQQQQQQQRAASSTPVAAAYPPRQPPQEKTLDALVLEFLSTEAPPPPEPVNETLALGDPDGWVAALGQLAWRRAWRKLVEIAGTMLVAHRGGGAPGLTADQAMDLRLRRAMGMLKLGRAVEAAEAAVEAGREAGQPPLAAVTVAARVAAAGAKSVCEGEAEEEALDELTALKFELEGVIAAGDGPSSFAPSPSEDGMEATTTAAAAPTTTVTVVEATTWRRRVMLNLVNMFVGRGNWRMALGLLEDLGEDQCSERSTPACSSSSHEEVTGAAGEEGAWAPVDDLRVELLSRIGRVFLQFGSVEDAEVYFRRAEAAAAEAGSNPRILVNRGLLDFSRNEFVAAQENFRNAATEAAMLAAKEEPPDGSDDNWLWATIDQGAGLLDAALNNLSLAMVYSCDVLRGVRTLEGLIRKDPRLYMLDLVIFNLCTLYDLSFDAVASAKKKRTLQAVAQRFRLEDIDASSFRMS